MRNLSSLFILLLLQGCQLQSLQPDDMNGEACQISEDQLFALQSTEKQFLSAPEQRGQLLQTAIQDKNRPLIALLMSTPYASKEQLQQARRHYNKLRLNLKQHCHGDRYLRLRDTNTSALLWLRSEQDRLEQRNQLLQRKIDALTQIESDLNQQREEAQ